jgi:hypothetical protein
MDQKNYESPFDNRRSPGDMGNYGGAKTNNQASTFGRTNRRINHSARLYRYSAPQKKSAYHQSYNEAKEQGIWNYIKEFFGIAFSIDKRADERIEENVKKALSRNLGVHAYGIEVSVCDGVVKLAGSVFEQSTKYQATDAVQRCRGVKVLQNELQVLSLDGET